MDADRIEIPEGPFLCGDPPRKVALRAFRIDRHPVTVERYARFVDAGGYRERKWWSRAGWLWRTGEAITAPRFWGEAEWASYLVPNHPVVGVSAFEAEAFAAFIGARLPTEAEWEKACRGVDGRLYPWGNTWREGASGERGVGPRSTVPIGAYPEGKSPYGLYDMLGCVWQWCADAADDEATPGDDNPFIDPDDYADDNDRVTRGGGWNNLRWSISCTSRNAYPPTARFSNLGFRCAE